MEISKTKQNITKKQWEDYVEFTEMDYYGTKGKNKIRDACYIYDYLYFSTTEFSKKYYTFPSVKFEDIPNKLIKNISKDTYLRILRFITLDYCKDFNKPKWFRNMGIKKINRYLKGELNG